MSTTNPSDALCEGFSGEVLEPAQPGYDDARRVFNGMFDRRPAVIAPSPVVVTRPPWVRSPYACVAASSTDGPLELYRDARWQVPFTAT